MNLDVTTSDNKAEYTTKCGLFVDFSSLLQIKALLYTHGDWFYDQARREATTQFDNCSKRLIRECQIELAKAKAKQRADHPIRTRIEVFKFRVKLVLLFFRHPIKFTLAWLQTSK